MSEIIKQDPVPALPGAVTEAESRTIVDLVNYVQNRKASHKVITNG